MIGWRGYTARACGIFPDLQLPEIHLADLYKRADIWSWGVVLYELLTGERMFDGDDAADTLAQVLTKEPDLERVPTQVRKLLPMDASRNGRYVFTTTTVNN